jgi:hypothetical protein
MLLLRLKFETTEHTRTLTIFHEAKIEVRIVATGVYLKKKRYDPFDPRGKPAGDSKWTVYGEYSIDQLVTLIDGHFCLSSSVTFYVDKFENVSEDIGVQFLCAILTSRKNIINDVLIRTSLRSSDMSQILAALSSVHLLLLVIAQTEPLMICPSRSFSSLTALNIIAILSESEHAMNYAMFPRLNDLNVNCDDTSNVNLIIGAVRNIYALRHLTIRCRKITTGSSLKVLADSVIADRSWDRLNLTIDIIGPAITSSDLAQLLKPFVENCPKLKLLVDSGGDAQHLMNADLKLQFKRPIVGLNIKSNREWRYKATFSWDVHPIPIRHLKLFSSIVLKDDLKAYLHNPIMQTFSFRYCGGDICWHTVIEIRKLKERVVASCHESIITMMAIRKFKKNGILSRMYSAIELQNIKFIASILAWTAGSHYLWGYEYMPTKFLSENLICDECRKSGAIITSESELKRANFRAGFSP